MSTVLEQEIQTLDIHKEIEIASKLARKYFFSPQLTYSDIGI